MLRHGGHRERPSVSDVLVPQRPSVPLRVALQRLQALRLPAPLRHPPGRSLPKRRRRPSPGRRERDERRKRPPANRLQDGGSSRREGGVVHGERRGVDLPAAGVRAVLEAPGGRSAHRLHQAEAAGNQPGGVLRGAGAHPAGTRCHPARSEPVQAHHKGRLRDAVPGLHQCQVSLEEKVQNVSISVQYQPQFICL